MLADLLDGQINLDEALGVIHQTSLGHLEHCCGVYGLSPIEIHCRRSYNANYIDMSIDLTICR
jgi:hypothetical protein